MSAQAQVTRARFVPATNAAPTQPTVTTLASPAQITLSPRTPHDLKTQGFAYFISGTGVTTITCWKREPHSGFWAKLFTVDGADLALFEWDTVCDVNPCELWFQTDAASIESEIPAGVWLEELGG